MWAFSPSRLLGSIRPSPYGFHFTLRPGVSRPELITFTERWWQVTMLTVGTAACIFFLPELIELFPQFQRRSEVLEAYFTVLRVCGAALAVAGVLAGFIRRELRITPTQIAISTRMFGVPLGTCRCARKDAVIIVFRADTSGRLTWQQTGAFVAIETPKSRFALAARELKYQVMPYARELAGTLNMPIEERRGIVVDL